MIFAVLSSKESLENHIAVDLLKYRHISSTFERVRQYIIAHSSAFLLFTFFDGKDSVYLQIQNRSDEQLFKKIDMITGSMCEGHVNIGYSTT